MKQLSQVDVEQVAGGNLILPPEPPPALPPPPVNWTPFPIPDPIAPWVFQQDV
jgi:hypothetical protein